MELEGAGDADAQQVQYITTDDQQQQYVIQGDGADGQTLLQGAKIVDGQLVLPQHYVTDSGETVILVYETPEGQQFMTEDGQQIVFQQEGAEDGQSLIDPQQIVTQMQEHDPQVQSGEQEMQVIVSEDQQLVSADQPQIAPGQSLLAPGVTMAASEHSQIQPGQSLLTGQTTFVQENEDGTTTVVTDPAQIAAALAAQQQAAVSGEEGQTQTVVVSAGESEGMSILSQAVSAIENGDSLTTEGVASSAAAQQQQISVQSLQHGSFPQTVKFENYNLPITSDMINADGPTTLLADGKEIQVQVLSNADFAAGQSGASTDPPPETLKLRNKADASGQIQIVMKTDENGQEYVEAQAIKDENGQVLLSHLDQNSPEMAQFIERIKNNAVQVSQDGTVAVSAEDIEGLVIAESKADVPVFEFGPGVINPETGLMEEPEESEFQEKEPNIPPEQLFMQVGDTADILNQAEAMRSGEESSEVKLQVEIFNEGSNKAEVTIVSVPVPGEGADGQKQLVKLEGQDGSASLDASDDSDFDEENLTPKVVYERLLAQHRRTKECQVCGELLENFLRLKEHLMEHAGYNPCECQKCGRILSTPEGRYRHEKAHEKQGSPQKGFTTPPQRVTCTVCGKIIARKEHLKRHMLIHQDCPTFKCLLCGYSFKREDLIKGHVKKFHPKQVEASSLDLLFEKSSDETAPERSQWNPHRKYRTTPKPPKVPGRSRGRPRKELDDGDSPGRPKKRGPKVGKFAKNIVIKTPDGHIVKPREDDTFDQLIIKTTDGRVVDPNSSDGKTPKAKRAGKRAAKTPQRFADAADDDDDIYNDFEDDVSDNSSEEGASQLLVRYAPEEDSTPTDASEASGPAGKEGEKPSKTSKTKKAKSAARKAMEEEDAPLWAQKKRVKVSFVGIGEEVKEAYEGYTQDIEEEIVVVMGGKGDTKIKSVKLVKTPLAAKKRAMGIISPPASAPRPKVSPKKTPGPKPKASTSTPVKPKTPATVERSRSGRVIQRRVQADGEILELPKAKDAERDVHPPSKKLRVDLGESPTKMKTKSGKTPTIVRVEVSHMPTETPTRGSARIAKIKEEEEEQATPRAGKKRAAGKLEGAESKESPAAKRTRQIPVIELKKARTPLKVSGSLTTPSRRTPKSNMDAASLMSEVKTVKCSTPVNRQIKEMKLIGTPGAFTPSRGKASKDERQKASSKEDRPKASTSKDDRAKSGGSKDEKQKALKSPPGKQKASTGKGPEGGAPKTPSQKDVASSKEAVTSSEAEYGTVTIEKGRIVGEITISKTPSKENESPKVGQPEGEAVVDADVKTEEETADR